jgi:hypothetical protein
MEGRLGNLEGWRYEWKFNPSSRIAPLIRGGKRVGLTDLGAAIDALEDGAISPEEWAELGDLDAIFRGRLGRGGDATEVLLALEISKTVDAEDVTRARTRADILARAGYQTVAAAGGRTVTLGARAAAEALDVHLLIDRSSDKPDAA